MAWWDHYDLYGNPKAKAAAIEDHLRRTEERRRKEAVHRMDPELWSEMIEAEYLKRQQLEEQMAIGSHTHAMSGNHDRNRDAFQKSERLLNMLRCRLRLDPGMDLGFAVCFAAEVGDNVHLFIVNSTEPVLLKDNKDLFPSDQLTTQVRLMRP